MMNKTKKILSAILAFVLLLSVVPALPASAADVTVSQVGALWDGFSAGTGTFTVTANSRLFVVADAEPTGKLLQTTQLLQSQLQADFSGSFTQLVYGHATQAKTGDIVLVLDTASGTGADGYKLNVTSTTATVTAADVDGLIYGTNNLMKCFRAVGGKSISCFSGNDAPDTKQRVVMLDTGRKYYTVEWVKNFIKQISWMGYNAIEIHFSEDGGFRADLWDPAYYKGQFQPENDFTWLCGSHLQSWVKNRVDSKGNVLKLYRNDPDANRYLTTAELVDICNTAKEYHIEVIPSFDSPAHMDYICWKFEQHYKSNTGYYFSYNGLDYYASATNGCINYTGRTGDSSPTWPYYTTININSDSNDDVANMAKAFVFALYEDMADFFKEYAGSTSFNIGADEVNLSSGYGIDWSYDDFPVYINDLNRLLNNKGYKVRMFNDFIGSFSKNNTTPDNVDTAKAKYSFDSNIEIVYWNSDFNPGNGTWKGSADNNLWHVKFFWENNNGTTDNWGDGGRTMYNAIQTNTYYVLREGTSGSSRDARDPDNRNWTFYHTNEKAIYDEWYPADISEKGVYTENAADVPASSLGGAYFLIWNDYASLSTESEVWNGALDCYDADRYYYLFDIMASNIQKMWNADINSTVSYNKFAEVREATVEWFPGFTSCSAAASLPKATTPVKSNDSDNTALTEALKTKLPAEDYTPSTYEVYDDAYAAAQAVNNNVDATQAQLDEALADLNAAIAALVKRADLTALQEAIMNAPSQAENYTADSFAAMISALEAAIELTENVEADQEMADEALEELMAAIEALVDISKLKGAVADAIPEQGDYTDDTWAAYQNALAAAEKVLGNPGATQTEVDKALENLNAARNGLTKDNTAGIEIVSVRKASRHSNLGKKATLIITTSVDAEKLEILLNNQLVELTTYASNVQTISGEQVRVWYVKFTTTEKGSIDYLIRVDNAVEETITVTVK